MNAPPIHLLLVDDSPIDAALARRLLQALPKELPIATQWVDTAEKAIAEIQHGQYDLLLLDYQLPHATGLDVLSVIQALPRNRRPAVIMLTASGSDKVAVEAMKKGACDYLRKDELDAAPLTRALLSALAQKRLENEVAAFHAQRDEDLSMAREMQRALIPLAFPAFPSSAQPEESALRFWGRYLPTLDLGGDFYDVLAISDTKAGLLVCDVMGHGVRAALVMAMIRAFVEELQPQLANPAALLTGLNAGLLGVLRKTGRPLFATAVYLVLDAARMDMRYARAGHPEPFIIGARTGGVARLPFGPGRSGPALGLFEDATFAASTLPLQAGDRLVLYTDGITEAANAGDVEYGADRLRAAIERHADRPCEGLFEDLLADARDFTGRETFADDVCLLGAEVRHAMPE